MSEGNDADEVLIAPLPRVTVQAFCETSSVAEVLERSADDRRMQKAHFKVQMGGAAAAAEAFRNAPTPNVLILEFQGERAAILASLDALASVCDAGTKVVAMGHVNDVILYRELIRRGDSEYLIAPFDVLDFVRALSELFVAPGADPVGRTVAVYGAKGGVGSSTVAHNLAWSLARHLATDTVLVDLDICFGTAALDFNQDPPQGIAEAVFAPERLDANLLDRLLSKCSDHLTLLAAPAMLDRTLDLSETALDGVVDLLRNAVPTIVLDMPHMWTAWVRRALVSADEIVIVAEPELASLRNTKSILDVLRQARPNDRRPKVVLNKVGVLKRPEISAAEFAKALQSELTVVIPFDAALFGSAANNGQMIAEVQATGKTTELFVSLAGAISGRTDVKRARSGNLLQPLMARLSRRKAS